MFARFAGGSASPQILRFTERRLEQFQNPNCKKLIQLAGDCDADWMVALETFLVDERKDHVDSVVASRHLIVHGQSVGVTYRRARHFFDSAKEVVDFVDDLVTV